MPVPSPGTGTADRNATLCRISVPLRSISIRQYVTVPYLYLLSINTALAFSPRANRELAPPPAHFGERPALPSRKVFFVLPPHTLF